MITREKKQLQLLVCCNYKETDYMNTSREDDYHYAELQLRFKIKQFAVQL